MNDRPTFPEMRRPLPSFAQWLDARGDGARGDGFAAFADLAARTQDQKVADMFSRDEIAMLRMWQGLSIACVELCNLEWTHGRTLDETVRILPRALACAAFYAAASVLKDESPWRLIAKILTEEFRHAAKVCADQYTETLAHGGEGKQ